MLESAKMSSLKDKMVAEEKKRMDEMDEREKENKEKELGKVANKKTK